MATLYYNAADDQDWSNLLNWWTSDAFTTQASALPTSSDSVVLVEDCSSNSGSEPTVVNLTFETPGDNFKLIRFSIAITVTGNASFFGSTENMNVITGNATFNVQSVNFGEIIGNATFNDGSPNAGIVTGDATFNGSAFNNGTVTGNATFNDGSTNNEGSTVDGDAAFGGTSSNSGTVSGTLTVVGNRAFTNNGITSYYIDNVATTLRVSGAVGTGLWNGQFYRAGSVYNFSGGTIYGRSTGNDANDGTVDSPVASAQIAYEMAFGTTGNKTLDFGAGSFGGITLTDNWPSRIGLQGAGNAATNLGGINATGQDQVWDFDNYVEVSGATGGFSLTLNANNSMNLGNINTSGGSAGSEYNYLPEGNAGSAGSVDLTDCVCGSISCVGGSIFDDMFDPTEYSAGEGGPVTLTRCIVTGAISSGGGGAKSGATGGGVEAVDTAINGSINTTGGSNNFNYDVAGSSGGAVILTRARGVTGIDASAGLYAPGNGGDITATDTVFNGGTVTSLGGSTGFASGSNGAITLSGTGTLPDAFGSSVNISGLRRGRGVNGSSILGLA
jgi:hypothetical protein